MECSLNFRIWLWISDRIKLKQEKEHAVTRYFLLLECLLQVCLERTGHACRNQVSHCGSLMMLRARMCFQVPYL